VDGVIAAAEPIVQPSPRQDDHIGEPRPVAQRRDWRVVTVAGFGGGRDERKALREAAALNSTLVQIHDDAAPPHARELLVIEDIHGEALSENRLRQYWHRPPYAMVLRLVRYAPGSSDGELIDGAVISTRDKREQFYARVYDTAARLLSDAIAGTGRGTFNSSFDAGLLRSRPWPLSSVLDRFTMRWRQRLLMEWWSVGFTTMPLVDILKGGRLDCIHWLSPLAGTDYLADPFPRVGTDQVFCEQRTIGDGNGSIVAIAPDHDGTFQKTSTILAGDRHHSYPCLFQRDGTSYLLPESPERGATVLYTLAADSSLVPICTIAPGRRLADPTLFHHEGRFWIAYTDLDIGAHNNLCLMHASNIEGPWLPHRCMPVKIDICGARSAGMPIRIGDALYRPAQDCAHTYGAGLVIHKVELLTPDSFRESVVSRLRPDPAGPFPHGLHTLAAGDDRVWLDGKRNVFSLACVWTKIVDRLRWRRRDRSWASAR